MDNSARGGLLDHEVNNQDSAESARSPRERSPAGRAARNLLVSMTERCFSLGAGRHVSQNNGTVGRALACPPKMVDVRELPGSSPNWLAIGGVDLRLEACRPVRRPRPACRPRGLGSELAASRSHLMAHVQVAIKDECARRDPAGQRTFWSRNLPGYFPDSYVSAQRASASVPAGRGDRRRLPPTRSAPSSPSARVFELARTWMNSRRSAVSARESAACSRRAARNSTVVPRWNADQSPQADSRSAPRSTAMRIGSAAEEAAMGDWRSGYDSQADASAAAAICGRRARGAWRTPSSPQRCTASVLLDIADMPISPNAGDEGGPVVIRDHAAPAVNEMLGAVAVLRAATDAGNGAARAARRICMARRAG
ncbi:hypothetical protein FQA39_LY18633 [Lamprigera yunnana]|nr:hypothetical protein FQA39_LY18633 [Lamprigera yunnana]